MLRAPAHADWTYNCVGRVFWLVQPPTRLPVAVWEDLLNSAVSCAWQGYAEIQSLCSAVLLIKATGKVMMQMSVNHDPSVET